MLPQIPAAVLWVWQASWLKRIFVAMCVGISFFAIVYGVFATTFGWLISGLVTQYRNPSDMVNLCCVSIIGFICALAASMLYIAMLAVYYTVRWILLRIFNMVVEIIVAPVIICVVNLYIFSYSRYYCGQIIVILIVIVLFSTPNDRTYVDFCQEQSVILFEKFLLPDLWEFTNAIEAETNTINRENGIICWLVPELTFCAL